MRTGAAYVAALRDGRAVYLDGERVKDVTTHPAFAEPIRGIAQTYDRAKAAGAKHPVPGGAGGDRTGAEREAGGLDRGAGG